MNLTNWMQLILATSSFVNALVWWLVMYLDNKYRMDTNSESFRLTQYRDVVIIMTWVNLIFMVMIVLSLIFRADG